ncbi:response regulator transcription factor [Pseudotenacibaculum sp. MALMAid0570]|uniref:response regulator transcription factor n=1 Tax=Pseudotenacibaculum sp. MALMAid0570 TaxID=3143938 RepID=UPI0032DF090C
MIRPSIFIADDHPILIKGLKDLLVEKGHEVVGTATNGQAAMNFILKNNPDIAILDVEMPFLTGIEIAKAIQKNNCKTKAILITLHKEVELYLQAKKINIYGYLLKEFALEEIEKCIQSVSENKPYFSEKIKNMLGYTQESKNILKELTMTERRIAKLISQHKSNKEIGHLLFISPRTVEKHRSNIINKLNLERKTGSLSIWVQKNKHLFR